MILREMLIQYSLDFDGLRIYGFPDEGNTGEAAA
jgi:hypothetical protein